MKYIGDISKEDAHVLGILGKGGQVLEFGMGGSTQVLAQVAEHLISVETDPDWVVRTRGNLDALGIDPKRYDLIPYFKWPEFVRPLRKKFDLIFVDGVDEMRFPFAIMSFPMLKVGGFMCFHDTRRTPDMANFLNTVLNFKDEIDHSNLNWRSSNISCALKKMPEPYVDWNKVEKREPWMTGAVPPPADWVKKVKGVQ